MAASVPPPVRSVIPFHPKVILHANASSARRVTPPMGSVPEPSASERGAHDRHLEREPSEALRVRARIEVPKMSTASGHGRRGMSAMCISCGWLDTEATEDRDMVEYSVPWRGVTRYVCTYCLEAANGAWVSKTLPQLAPVVPHPA